MCFSRTAIVIVFISTTLAANSIIVPTTNVHNEGIGTIWTQDLHDEQVQVKVGDSVPITQNSVFIWANETQLCETHAFMWHDLSDVFWKDGYLYEGEIKGDKVTLSKEIVPSMGRNNPYNPGGCEHKRRRRT
ncbi:MAG: hypothetical protein M1813_007993 [Trichoglossum hirsutum]|nr:MAG: hypothetical protein M1813_007993 [Trichoglossum hirsutum]